MRRQNWIGLMAMFGGVALAGSCGDEDAATSTSATEPATAKVGDACTGLSDTECRADLEVGGWTCLTDELIEDLAEGEFSAEIPAGYCTRLICLGDGKCGPGAFCADLEQYLGMSFSVCLKSCDTNADCREDEGYLCHDGASDQFEALPQKICVAPSLLCLLDIPNDECPNVGMGGMGGAGGGTGGGTGGAGGGTGGSTGGAGGTGGG